ncbi:MAG: biliverdin-producing heme oxygenase [Phycisphaerae bacterium]
MISNGIMNRLRDETRPQHEHAESRPFEQALAAGRLPRELYVENLGQRLCMHKVLEAPLRQLVARDPRLADLVLDEQYQTPNLHADLAFFGIDAAVVRPRAATAALVREIEAAADQEPLALLGFFYVFEGSKNGAHFLAKRLRAAYQLEQNGLRYFDPHGDQQRPLWHAFKARMDLVPLTPAEADAIVAAARATFQRVAEVEDEIYYERMGAAPAA